ncbi:MAG: hypothetical protein GXZ13_02640, partial [Synergistaceae bacterium]|nr:hypothetical protein [Synergistaceae bacterium]
MLGIQMKFNEQVKSIEIIEAKTPKEPTARYQRVYSPIKEIPSNFVAIDFETANSNRCSPCSVGIAIVKNGEIADSFER